MDSMLLQWHSIIKGVSSEKVYHDKEAYFSLFNLNELGKSNYLLLLISCRNIITGFVGVCVWLHEKERWQAAAFVETREIKRFMRFAAQGKRFTYDVQYCYRIAICTHWQRLHCHFCKAFKMTLNYFNFPVVTVLVFSVGAHHSVVHRLPVPHPGLIPGLLRGKGVK